MTILPEVGLDPEYRRGVKLISVYSLMPRGLGQENN